MTTAGPNLPGLGADNSAAGTLTWSNPTFIETAGPTDGSSDAVASGTGDTHYLVGSNFGFAIPSAAPITGITVTVLRANFAGTVHDKTVQLAPSGTLAGSNKAVATNWTNGSYVTATYGSLSDTWSLSLTGADLNNSSFAVFFQATSASGAPRVENIQITVTYSPIVTSTRTIAPTAGLKATVTRTIAPSMGFRGSPTRSIASTAALKGMRSRTIAPTAGLKATLARTLASSLFLQPMRRIAASIGLLGTATRQITPTLLLAYHTVPPLHAATITTGATDASGMRASDAITSDDANDASLSGPLHAVVTGLGGSKARIS